MIQSLQTSHPSRIVFDTPELLEIQRQGFYSFLKEGIIEEFSKISPIKIETTKNSLEFTLDAKRYKLISPEVSPRECILKMKSYACKLYIEAKLICKTKADNKILHKRTEWILVGNLPMMTKRGHFIINGSPRVVVHQVIRAPGIYFQQIVDKSENKQTRFYGDIIPRRGVWLRLQINQYGKVDARLKKSKKVEAELLQRCLEVIEEESQSPQNLPPGTEGKMKSPVLASHSDKSSYAWPSQEAKLLDFVSQSIYEVNAMDQRFSNIYNSYDNKKESQRLISENNAFCRTYDKLYRPVEDKEREELEARRGQHFFSDAGKGNKRQKCYKNLFETFKIPARYDLGEVGREKLNEKFGIDVKEQQLTSLDIKEAISWLQDLQKGYKMIDDIDHSQNRRIKSSGELLQNQFENGVDRLKKLIWVKLKELATVLDSLEYEQPQTSVLLTQPQAKGNVGEASFREMQATSVNLKNVQLKFAARPISQPLEEKNNDIPLQKTGKRNLSSLKETLKDKSLVKLQRKGGDLGKNLNLLKPSSGLKKSVNLLISGGRGVTVSKKKDVRNAVQAEMSLKDFITTKPINGALREFFGSNPLSQYMDQTNPLAELTHKRRISSLGLGGVSRESAGMAIRGIHPTHYGRICPIETPEGKNAGLVNSLAFYAKVNEKGFIETPYYNVIKGQVQQELGFFYLSAKEENGLYIAPSDLYQSSNNVLGKLGLSYACHLQSHRSNTEQEAELLVAPTLAEPSDLERGSFEKNEDLKQVQVPAREKKSLVPVRIADNFVDIFQKVEVHKVDSIGISPIQMISIATSLIPFLEHNDANRALMGSNMQRQAVPLMIAERPLVGTGLEALVVAESGHITQAERAGYVSSVQADKIIIESLIQLQPWHWGRKGKSRKQNITNLGSSFFFRYPMSPRSKACRLCFSKQIKVLQNQGKGTEKQKNKIRNNKVLLFTPPSYRDFREHERGISNSYNFLWSTQSNTEEFRKYSVFSGFKAFNQILRGAPRQNPSSLYGFGYLNPVSNFVSDFATLKSALCHPRRRLFSYIQQIDVHKKKAQVDKYTDLQESLVESVSKLWKDKGSLLYKKKLKDGNEKELLNKLSKRVLAKESRKQRFFRKLNLFSKINGRAKGDRAMSTASQWNSSAHRPLELCSSGKGLNVVQVLDQKKEKTFTLIPFHHSIQTLQRSNQDTCLIQRCLVKEGDWVQRGDILADGSASHYGELSVGKNILVAYIPWEGYNFEDAIVISERLVQEHVYTSLHVERYDFEAQDFKGGNEWFTNILPSVPLKNVKHLDHFGLPRIGSFVQEGDILVGKISCSDKKPTTPYERLLSDILEERSFAARDASLYVPRGVQGRVINQKVIEVFEHNLENRKFKGGLPKIVHIFLAEKRRIQVGDKMSGRHGNKGIVSNILPRQDMPYLPDGTPIDMILNPLGVPSRMNVGQVFECLLGLSSSYLAQHFKMTAFDEIYGPEASRSLVYLKLYQARLQSGQSWLFQIDFPGKTRLIDGRSGECFDQWITVGKAYMLKLIHMVNDKIHARATGPYALVTQQPLRGRSQQGGQRLGEMEVWALEGFGAAYTLQELLTKKSDDVIGRKEVAASILPRPTSILDMLEPTDNTFQKNSILGNPEIFKVLVCELQSLCLDVGVYSLTDQSFQRKFIAEVD